MARHLRLLGHDVTVVTTSAFGRMRSVEEERHVHRAGDLTSVGWVRRSFRRGPMPPPSDTAVLSVAPPESPLPDAVRKIFVPDLYILAWIPQALRLARRVVSEQAVECVITTSPYESTHLIGPALQRRGPAWIADFRDGWLFEPHRPRFPTSPQRALDRRLEQRVVYGADQVVTATGPIAQDFKRRFSVDAVHIANGFDRRRHPELPSVVMPTLAPNAVVLAHTGKLAGINDRDPRGLFAAMRRLRDENPAVGERLRLVLAGRLDTEDLRMVVESDLDEQIVRLGERSHAESLALQRQADALALIASSGSEVTGKLFEYLSAGRPIIALAGSEVARIIARTGTGVTVRPDDVDAIAAQLRRLVTGQLADAYHPADLEPYVYPGPALRMAEVIEEALTRRASHRLECGF